MTAPPYGDGRYAAEPPAGDGLNITDIFNIVKPKKDDPDIRSRIDSQYPNVAIITFDEKNQFGGMWAKEKLDLTLPFATEMYLYMEREYGKTGNVADGMTFTLHNDPDGLNAIGGAGEGLGVYKGRKWVGPKLQTKPHGTFLKNSLVIEFDTYRNSAGGFVFDPGAAGTSHCAALQPITEFIGITDHRNSYAFTPKQDWVKFEASWTPDGSGGGTLAYSFAGEPRAFRVNNILSTFKDTKVYWGFTGATGDYTSVQAAAITSFPRQGIRVGKTVKNLAGDDIDHGVVFPGDTVSYTIRVTAVSDTTGPFNIEDDVSGFLELEEEGNVLFNTSTGDTYTIPYTMSGTTMSVDVDQDIVNEDEWFEITFEARVSDDAGGQTIINDAIVSTADLSENSNETDITVFANPEKSVSNASDAGKNGSAVRVGDLITYNISYGNESAFDEDIIITDELPDGVDYMSSTDEGSYNAATHTVTWNILGLAPNGSGVVSVVVRVNQTAVVTIENEATVQVGTNPAQYTNRVVNPVTPEGPTKVIHPGSVSGHDGEAVKLGDDIIYGITYLNNLTGDATVTITDELPDGVDFRDASDGGEYNGATHTVTWILRDVPSGMGGMVSLTVRVNEDAVVRIENEATVQVDDENPLTTNPVINPVAPENPVKMISENSKAGQNGGAVKEGDRISYEITYLNYHETDATIVITDKLSPGVDFMSASENGAYDEATHTVTWTLYGVPSGTRGTVSLLVLVNENAVVSIENSATVQVGEDGSLNTNIVVNPLVELQCPKISRKCRTAIKGCKIWADNDNVDGTRPLTVEIVLLRDGEVYRRKTIDSMGDGNYIFDCLPVWKNSEDRYSYRIDELEVPDNYVKRVEGYNVINTLTT